VLVAPLGTPDPIVNKVSEALRKAVADPELQKKVAVSGNYLRQMTPEQTLAYIQAEQQMWKPILEDIEAHPER
jgi:tripartite-type tricarboxylate transporter receptor subunit TctC